MIVNQTTLTEQDIDFINAQLRKQPKVIALRIIAVLLGIFWLFAAGLIGYMQLKYHDRSLSDLLLAAAFVIFGVLVLYKSVFLKQSSHRTSLKYKSLFAPRTYTCDGSSITAHHAFEGNEVSNKLALEKAVCYFAGENAVVLRFSYEKNQQIYMCLHDDGYSEGSREELTALLDSKGIRCEKV
ncbi:MAG: hypothetical protein IKQ39_02080 [Oscillospiraceae bacterium]|nr:hypothetical protein [Oscillospiraceae bacterium]